MTQKELCKGICTPVTISKLESKNIAPTVDILIKICTRLGISLNDVFDEFSASGLQALQEKMQQTELLTTIQQHKEAKKVLQTVKEESVRDTPYEEQYHFLKGDILLVADQDYEDAKFEFDKVLNITLQNGNNLYTALTYNCLGVLYFKQKQNEKAAYYFRLSCEFVEEVPELNSHYVSNVIRILDNSSRYFSKIGEYEESNELIERGLKLTKEYRFGSYKDTLSYIYAYNLYELDREKNKKQITDLIGRAKIYAQDNDNHYLLKKIEDFEETNNLKEKA